MAFVFRSERNIIKSLDYQNESNNNKNDQPNNLLQVKPNENILEDTNLINNRYNILDSPSPPFLSSVERIKSNKKNDETPGPGSYNISKGYYNKHRQFSSRQDNSIPEEYDLINMPLLRMKEVINDNPGPGHYYPSEKDLFGGRFKNRNKSTLNARNKNNSSLSNISQSNNNIIRQTNNDKDNSKDMDNDINKLLYIYSPKKRKSENNTDKKVRNDCGELIENYSMKNIRGPLSIHSSNNGDIVIQNKNLRGLNNNNSKISGMTLDTERTSINSSKLNYSQIRNKSSTILQKINNQLNNNIFNDNQDSYIYNHLVSSTEQNIFKHNTLSPISLKYDKSRIYKNEQNHDRLLLAREQNTNYYSKNFTEFDKLLNSEYFSQSPGPGYYDPIDLSNQRYYNPKNIKNYFNTFKGQNVTSLVKINKIKKTFPGPGQYKADNNMIENKIKNNMSKKMRDILFDVKKIAKLRILREKEALERSKNLDYLLKEKNTEKVNYENNLKDIIDKDYIKFKDIHSPKDFLFNFGSNDKRFKEKKKEYPGPGEYETNLYKSIEEKNANIKENPNYQELYNKSENKNYLIERFSLNKDILNNPPVGHYNPNIISSIKYNAEYKNQIKSPVICRNIFNKNIEKMTFKKAEEIKEKEKKLISYLGPGKYYNMLNKTFNDVNKSVDKKPPFGSSEEKLQFKKKDLSPGPGYYDINSYYNWITRTYNILFS